MYKVSFFEQGRTGNLIFQYLACKLIQLKFGHSYIPYEKFAKECLNEKNIEIGEENLFPLFENESQELNGNVILKGFFQKSDIFVKYRKELLDLLDKSLEDTWKLEGKEYSISQFIDQDNHKLPISKNDIILNLRLDDFIQLPRERSDILPPNYYLEMLNTIPKNPETKIYIICDKIKCNWENQYLECFKHYNITVGIPGYNGTIWEDFKIMRDCDTLIHSNSTFCWIASFLSKVENKKRFIPRTNFYGGQNLKKINETDVLLDVNTLSHHDVFNLRSDFWKRYPIYSFSYSIPDQLIVKEVPEKLENISSNKERYRGNIPYVYTKEEEEVYYEKYRKCNFGNTKKKGGWDCLRHYEILMNGCIPIFENLKSCPKLTMTTFPKSKIIELNQNIDMLENNKEYYNEETNKLLIHLRDKCSSTFRYKEFLKYNNIAKEFPNVLMISGDIGVNYLRDFFWIGAKNINPDNCFEYPTLDYLYDDFLTKDFKNMPGNGFTYGGILSKDRKKSLTLEEIMQNIKDKKWDIIVYGKTGPDEGVIGSIPNLPLWKEVIESEIPIAFLCGGDEQFKVSSNYNSLSGFERRYVDFLKLHSRYGTCFVRELN